MSIAPSLLGAVFAAEAFVAVQPGAPEVVEEDFGSLFEVVKEEAGEEEEKDESQAEQAAPAPMFLPREIPMPRLYFGFAAPAPEPGPEREVKKVDELVATPEPQPAARARAETVAFELKIEAPEKEKEAARGARPGAPDAESAPGIEPVKRVEEPERAEIRRERLAKPESPDRREPLVKPDAAGKPEPEATPGRSERAEKPEGAEKPERAVSREGAEPPERERTGRRERPDRPEPKAERTERPERAEPVQAARERPSAAVETPVRNEARPVQRSEPGIPVARAAPVMPDAAPARSPVVREIAIRLPGEVPSRPVDVHLVDRQGKVQVEVLTDDTRLAASLRENVGELVDRLRGSGYAARAEAPRGAEEKTVPGVVNAPERVEMQESKLSGGREQFQGDGGHQQQQHGQHQQGQQRGNRPRWMEEMLRYTESGSEPEEETVYGGS